MEPGKACHKQGGLETDTADSVSLLSLAWPSLGALTSETLFPALLYPGRPAASTSTVLGTTAEGGPVAAWHGWSLLTVRLGALSGR